jgi:hypothetical protein
MLPNEKSNGEKLGQEQSFWLCNLAILHTILAEGEFSWHPLSLTNYTPSCKQVSRNQTTSAQQEAEGEQKFSGYRSDSFI